MLKGVLVVLVVVLRLPLVSLLLQLLLLQLLLLQSLLFRLLLALHQRPAGFLLAVGRSFWLRADGSGAGLPSSVAAGGPSA